jgi:hypothetical protein
VLIGELTRLRQAGVIPGEIPYSRDGILVCRERGAAVAAGATLAEKDLRSRPPAFQVEDLEHLGMEDGPVAEVAFLAEQLAVV